MEVIKKVEKKIFPGSMFSQLLLRVELKITLHFMWNEEVHGTAEAFWAIVEDVGEVILYHDSFILKQKYAEEDHVIIFTVPLFNPLQPNYFISILTGETRPKWRITFVGSD